MLRITRYLREYARRGATPVGRTNGTYQRDGERLDASFYALPGRHRRGGWVVLHGLTAVGREHPSLDRFVRALAATDTLVMVPDIPEWRDLRIAASVSVPTIRSAVRSLAEHPLVDPGRVGLMGFSFGATQSIVAAADPTFESTLRGLAAWGGYRDMHRLFRFGMVGEHELDGVEYHRDPDPYGRWISGADYLPRVPGYEEYQDVADALRALAMEAGRRRLFAWDPAYDPDKVRLRSLIAEPRRAVFDLFAPLTGQPVHDRDRAIAIGNGLADALLRAEPLVNPGPALKVLRTTTVIAHGRDDRLVPFTESIRLGRELRTGVLRRCTITGLFAHAGGTEKGLGAFGTAREGAAFVGLLSSIIDLI